MNCDSGSNFQLQNQPLLHLKVNYYHYKTTIIALNYYNYRTYFNSQVWNQYVDGQASGSCI